jgi:uncharacterized protein YggU (UPF0235/DUF167 family)
LASPGLVTRQGTDLLLSVRLTPKAAHDRIDGAEVRADGRAVLKARVRAVPEAGKANEALLQLLARSLDLPARALSLASGSTGRVKTIRIAGAPAGLEDRIAALAGDAAA